MTWPARVSEGTGAPCKKRGTYRGTNVGCASISCRIYMGKAKIFRFLSPLQMADAWRANKKSFLKALFAGCL